MIINSHRVGNRAGSSKQSINTRYLKNAILWGIIGGASRGRSAHSDIKSFKRRERDITIIRVDTVEEEVKVYIFKDRSLGVDD